MEPRAITLFRELADCSPSERDEYFIQHDIPAELRADVESLLRFDREASDSLRDGIAQAARRALLRSDPVLGNDDGATRNADATAATDDGDHDEGRFPAGTVLAERYRIISVLGRGGMGEVYRATDLRLRQPVALKLLPARMSHDERFLARLHSEVRLARQVSHPNVCRVYDIGEFAGGAYISMEYIDGEDLASLLRRIGRLPLEKTLEIARGLCAGLAAAHDKQVVHRDLKPANAMLDRRGRVAITDFGLASTARGLKGDDIRSGTPPPLETIVRDLDPALATLVGRCLELDPSKRPASALAVAAELPVAVVPVAQVATSIVIEQRSSGADAQRIARPRWRPLLPWIVAAASVIAIWLTLARDRAPVVSLSKISVALPQPFIDNGRPSIALSPDGSRLAFIAQHGDTTAVYLRPVDGFESLPLPGTEGATSLLFSPDGEWIAFHATRRLRKISIRGGPPVVLAEMPDFTGASWSTETGIIASAASSDLVRIAEDGGEAKSIVTSSERANTQVARRLPYVLPGGRAILFSLVRREQPQGSLAVRVLDSGEERILIPDATQPSYLDGWVIFARSGTLCAVRFDTQRLAVVGTAVPVLQGVSFVPAFGSTQYSLSASGRLAYVPGAAAVGRTLASMDRTGALVPLSELRRAYYTPRVAPDGARVATTILEDGAYGIWLADIPNGRPSLLAERSLTPVWSPDGRRIAFTSVRDGGLDIVVRSVDDPNSARTVVADTVTKAPSSWTRDGKSIVFTRVDPSGITGEDIYIVNEDGAAMRPLLQSAENESGGAISPDGNWIAFSVGSLITGGVAVAPLGDPSRQTRVDAEAATMPVWSRDGRELFLLAGPQRNRLMTASVVVAADGDLRLATPRLVFEHTIGPSVGLSLPRYDVMPDGQRFVFATAQDSRPVSEIRLTLDWMQQLRTLMTDARQ